MAFRPLSQTLSVTQGKGLTSIAASVSAAMESIELAHAEHGVPLQIESAPLADLDVPYDPMKLPQHPGSLFNKKTVISWARAEMLGSKIPTVIPVDCVTVRRSLRKTWETKTFSASSNGLASGNCYPEAALHGLYELVERHCVSTIRIRPPSERRLLNLESVDDPACSELIQRIAQARVWAEVEVVEANIDVPCFVCYIWSEDGHSAIAAGSGAHSNPGVALARALTEAAQSRLTGISGTRDDISPKRYRPIRNSASEILGRGATKVTDWATVIASSSPEFDDLEVELAWLVELVEAVTDEPTLAIDLGTDSDISVVKVVSPKLSHTMSHEIFRTSGLSK
jgi:ribosomal protein S12 methylthiotransferase accessory factor